MIQPETIALYGRTVELEPIEPDEEVTDVVVVVKTRSSRGASHTVSAANTPDGQPPRMSGDLRYLMELGLDPEQISRRAGRTPTAITRELDAADID